MIVPVAGMLHLAKEKESLSLPFHCLYVYLDCYLRSISSRRIVLPEIDIKFEFKWYYSLLLK